MRPKSPLRQCRKWSQQLHFSFTPLGFFKDPVDKQRSEVQQILLFDIHSDPSEAALLHPHLFTIVTVKQPPTLNPPSSLK